MRLGDVLGNLAQLGQGLIAHAGVEGTDRTLQGYPVGHDIETLAAIEDAEGEHHRILVDVHASADDRLRGHDDVGTGDNRIDAAPGCCAVRLQAMHGHAKRVRAGHDAPSTQGHVANVVRRGDVHAEHGVGLEILEHALLDHQLGTALLARRRAFLGRLEDHHDLARQILAQAGQGTGHAERGRGMHIVATGVHDADLLALVFAFRPGGEGQVDFLGHRQGIDIGANRQLRPRLATLEDADDAGMRDAGMHLVTQLLQFGSDEPGGTRLAIAQFGMFVDIPAQRGDVREPRIDHSLDGGFRGARDRRTAAKANTSGKQAVAHGNLPEVNAQSNADARRMQQALSDAPLTIDSVLLRSVIACAAVQAPCMPREDEAWKRRIKAKRSRARSLAAMLQHQVFLALHFDQA